MAVTDNCLIGEQSGGGELLMLLFGPWLTTDRCDCNVERLACKAPEGAVSHVRFGVVSALCCCSVERRPVALGEMQQRSSTSWLMLLMVHGKASFITSLSRGEEGLFGDK